MKILLTGNDLTIEKVWSVAVEGVGVEISPEADAKLEASRQLVYDLVDEDVPVYGFNTGVGWNKDHTIAKEFFGDFNRKLIYSHSLGIAPEASEAEVRAMMLIRLNCLLQGYTGIQPAVARRYAEFLNEGIHPVVPERGSVGEGDIAVMSHIGLAMIGEGEVNYKGKRMSSMEAHKMAGLEPVVLGPKDGLAIVSNNAFAAGQGALVLKFLRDLADMGDIVYSVSLEGLNGNTSPLDPSGLAPRKLKGQQVSAERVRKVIEGSSIYDRDPDKPVQDPLCFRGAVHVNGTLRDALDYVTEFMDIQMNSTDDNPCVLVDERRMISVSNFETTSLATGLEMLSIVLSHVSRMSCYRMLKLCDPEMTGLSRFLSHDGGDSHCFGAFQKSYALMDTEIRHLSNPCSADFMSLAGEIEDHANNTPLVVQKLRKAADNLAYVYGMEMIHGCQAIDLRMRKSSIRLGKGTEAAWKAFRKKVSLYENDRPISPDIQKAYEFIKSNVLLSEVEYK
ncbi:MAG TPA: aromatic amino acid ammonia-lyase [Synergistaceae bacterium]|nr:aromatic amino acid lyase [Synergistaceae bacterium]NLL40599.1 aromatic amino acid lyase [Synergistaceae bacterium]HQA55093.1 aromatic amino acid ammonia-lyase [Synergistaceae bacterium]